MGCISSKHVANSSISPLHDSSLTLTDNANANANASIPSSDCSTLRSNHSHDSGLVEKIKEEKEDDLDDITNNQDPATKRSNVVLDNYHSNNNKHSNRPAFSFSVRFGRSTVAEHVAAGWPAWLSAVAGEAIDGWLPLKSENFEKFEKIGKGTYSSVYRARDLRTGRMMALKKVRFDHSQPESVRFMAREITILRRLDHPNVMKLEGIITSRLASSIYLVFEYMEHDLAGLLSCPNIRFTESQIKCYMRQLLKGIEHCHSRGVLHRDIKTSNILLNNEGQLKIGDFGLANFLASKSRQPLTSRVVTMWYRPPELLLGSTDYGTYVDLWSVGCVFAELFVGRPILKGRTEVEQLHKIFMLCGTPPEEYWKKSTLPLATMFKPRHAYESSLKERCSELPTTAVNLIETFLSVEPENRGTATSALESEYFNTKPYACDLASLPTYPPNKEMDAKLREEAYRKKAGGRLRVPGTSRSLRRSRKNLLEQATLSRVVPTESHAQQSACSHGPRVSEDGLGPSKAASYDTVADVSQTTEPMTAPATASNGRLGWSTKRRKHVSFVTPTSQDVHSIEPSHWQDTSAVAQVPEYEKFRSRAQSDLRRARHAIHRQQNLGTTDSSSDLQEQERLRYSGPMLIQPHRTNGRHEGYSRNSNSVPKSRFARDAEQ